MYYVYEQKDKTSEIVLLATFVNKKYAIDFLRARSEFYLKNNKKYPYYLSFKEED